MRAKKRVRQKETAMVACARLGAVLLTSVLLTVGCAHQSTTPEGPHLAGVIMAAADRIPTQSTPARIWVTVDPPGSTDAAGLHIWPDTEIVVHRAGGPRQRGSVHDLAHGTRYRAWHDGVEFRSLPPQYRATRIEVW
jgi:hypothetical protein